MKTIVGRLYATKEDVKTINQLFEIDLSQTDEYGNLLPDMQAKVDNLSSIYHIAKEGYIVGFIVEFPDGRTLTWDLYMGDNNIWDEVNLYDKERPDEMSVHLFTFESNFSFEEVMEFHYGKEDKMYQVLIRYVKEDDSCITKVDYENEETEN